jgi:hypothetical protein
LRKRARKNFDTIGGMGSLSSFGPPVFATHNATHSRRDLHVLRRTYAAVRDLQVVEGRDSHSLKRLRSTTSGGALTHRFIRVLPTMSSSLNRLSHNINQSPMPARNDPFIEGVTFINRVRIAEDVSVLRVDYVSPKSRLPGVWPRSHGGECDPGYREIEPTLPPQSARH